MSANSKWRRAIAALLLPIYLSSCSAWRVPAVSPAQAIADDEPSRIRVTLSDSSRVEMEQPEIAGDTLRGLARVRPSPTAPRNVTYSLEPRDILLADVEQMEIKRSEAWQPLLVIGLSAVALTVIFASTCCAIGLGGSGG